MTQIAALSGVDKAFGDRLVLSIDSLTLETGQVVALIGPNGAGKTTLLRIISGLWVPTRAQRLEVLGADLLKPLPRKKSKQWSQQLGFASNSSQLFGLLTVRENLEYVCRLYGVHKAQRAERINRSMELCNVADRSGDQVWTLSTGLKQRVNIARAMVTNPKLIFLDEPTSGLDPLAANDVYGVIRRLQNSGVTVLLSTHIMTEVNDLCDRVLFLSKGRIMADASPEQLRMRAGEVVYQLQVPTSQKQSVITRLNNELGARTIIHQDDGVEVDVLAFGLSNSNLLDQMGLTYTRRDAQLADTFWLLGGAE